MRISDWSSDVCSSDLDRTAAVLQDRLPRGDRVRQRLCRCRSPARARRDDGQDRLCGLSAPLCRGGTLMRTILVPGGAGFIGSAVSRHLTRRGLTPAIHFDNLTYSAIPASLTTIPGYRQTL